MVTILDVARKAGVSKATVSRALNGKVVVSEDVKARIFQAIEETGYRPNLLARKLATSESNSVGLVITNGLYNGPFFSAMIYQAATCSEDHQRQLVLADGKHSREDERNAINFLLQLRCEAIMIYPKYLSVDELDDIIDQNTVPVVVINRELKRNRNNAVYVDHHRCSMQMMNYLLEQGHRTIAFVGGAEGSPTGDSRLAGYRDALNQAGIVPDESLIVRGSWSTESGYEAGCALLKQRRDMTCILAANDDMAIGVTKALTDQGFRVPQDISVAGFDDSTIGRYFTPTLTTVHIPMDEMISDAVRILLSPTADSETAPLPRHEGTLIIRESVAARR
ncbi:TPA: LacI family DNA-binding transcriptional regulator [Escherichia coli]|uniref:LacI family DNA-binding transcriptional regulator n=1 Tax=Escherichia coli TaxID=562 RepID=UPI0017E2798F|nr:LacI family DNA-binding transcriptional regulator [Escherichia coli]MBA2201897.1 LacI family DNA-binding transcriptional regulator [Escherichia coli]MBW9531074.1 LacI family DNA-binding transcriptional regulator [Escherichia coli]MBW9549013.1 LacI family DNA-binding transcriptional regulator [Escherichia coli]MBW9553517.1 LacI family DNA-binding transcriptional regulator [Escherichia coli]MBW9557684.1 LacI family DNA-binding transcriptional regulator [Escherichia coli]